MRLLVAPAHRAAALERSERPSHVVSLVSPGEGVPIVPKRALHLVQRFNDIAAPRPGLVSPEGHDVAALLAFARDSDGRHPLLVHCGAGISRSTAAAYVIACDRMPDRSERDLARALRAASPHATPNTRVVALADDLLARGGRMVDAVASLGRGAEWVPDPSFRLDLTARSCPIPT